MSIFTKVWSWLSKLFTNIEEHVIPVAIAVTEHVKQIVESKEVGFIVQIVYQLTKSQIPAEIIGLIQRNIPRILAIELALSHPPVNPTPEELTAFENQVLEAIGGKNLVEKSKVWTVLSAQLVGIIQAHLGTAEGQTFGGWVSAIEEAYADYKADTQGT